MFTFYSKYSQPSMACRAASIAAPSAAAPNSAPAAAQRACATLLGGGALAALATAFALSRSVPSLKAEYSGLTKNSTRSK